MTKISNLYGLTNYVTANSSGNVVIAAPTSGYALDVTGTGRFTGALTGTSITLSNSLNFTSIYGGNINGYDGTSLVPMNYSASQHQYYAGGTLKMTLLGNGNLLLGTTTDNGSKLQVTGTASFSGALSGTSATFTSTIFGNAPLNNTVISTSDATNISNGFNLLGSSSYWGIRTNTSGNFNLDVYGAGSTKNALSIAQATGAATFSSSVTATSVSATDATGSAILTTNGGGEGVLSVNTANPLRFFTNGSEKMRITSAGNVGIGTTTISTNSLIRELVIGQGITNGVSKLSFRSESNSLTSDISLSSYLGENLMAISTTSNIPMLFVTNSSERMRITSGGNVGIGTTSPTSLFHVSSSSALRARFYSSTAASFLDIENGGNSFYIGVDNGSGSDFGGGPYARTLYGTGAYPMTFWTNGTERMRITSGGNLLIGTTTDNSSGKLQVEGGIGLSGNITNLGTGSGTYTRCVWYVNTSEQILFENGRTTDSAAGTGRTVYFTWRGGPSVGGGVQLQHGANAWAAYTSDARLKTIVANVENGIDTVMKLNPVKYKWTKELETSRTVLGFTAQNVGEAIPEAMFKSWKDEELGDVLSYYQEYLTPYLVKAIQELKAELDTLKNK